MGSRESEQRFSYLTASILLTNPTPQILTNKISKLGRVKLSEKAVVVKKIHSRLPKYVKTCQAKLHKPKG